MKQDTRFLKMRIISIITITIPTILLDILFNWSLPHFDIIFTIFTSLATISAIWSACYLLFFQLYKDTNPLQLMRQKNLNSMSSIFINIVFSILFGSFVIAFQLGIFTSIWFIIISLFTIIEIFLKFSIQTDP